MPGEDIADILAQARRELMRGAPLDVEAWAGAHPGHAGELRRLLPALAALAREVQTDQVAARTREHALGLFTAAFAAAAAPSGTLGEVVSRVRTTGSDSLLTEVEAAGLPGPALAELAGDATPVEKLQDNSVVKAIADRLGVGFRAVKVGLAKLLAVDRFLQGSGPAMAFTRGEATSEAQQADLLRRVREDALDNDKGKPDPQDPA